LIFFKDNRRSIFRFINLAQPRFNPQSSGYSPAGCCARHLNPWPKPVIRRWILCVDGRSSPSWALKPVSFYASVSGFPHVRKLWHGRTRQISRTFSRRLCIHVFPFSYPAKQL
jgi:hypothetical protein